MNIPNTEIPTNPRNANLSNAKKAKQDEFYTQLGDIENELKHYKAQLRGKTIYCNCDDPYESNFFKYFALNFNSIGLRKIIATGYNKSSIVGTYLPLFDIEGKESYVIEINEVPDALDNRTSEIYDLEYLLMNDANISRSLKSDGRFQAGDFRSRECVDLLQQADVVITNPPFSLFREYVAQLVEHNKHFLIIGNLNAVTYINILKLIKENKLWLGESLHSGSIEFRIPAHYQARSKYLRIDDQKNKYIPLGCVRWFTNIAIEKSRRSEFMPLSKKYSPREYPKYDLYNAIEVSKAAEIPMDYDGLMGVPITFLDKYNPAQFEIVGLCTKPMIFEKEKYKRILIKKINNYQDD